MQTDHLHRIIAKHGTPLYVYDVEVIERQFNRLESAFESVSALDIRYAVKALSNVSILKYIKSLGAGLDTVSIQEILLGLEAGFAPESIMYTPNGVSLEEIEKAAQLGVNLNIDNLIVLEEFGSKHPDTPVCIRINPHIMAGGNSNISVGHIDSKFGISIHQLPHIKRVVQNTGMKINGVHMHTGSDILDIEVFMSAADILFDVARNFEHIEFIDFGSGFKVAYKSDDYSTDIENFGPRLSAKFNEFCNEIGKDLRLMFEPGKFLVSESGKFISRVNSVKQTTSTVFAQLDTGFNHFMRPMMYNAYHEIENISNPEGAQRFYTVTGYICETDTFATNRPITEIQQGDYLSFSNAGAYCFSMSSQYNSRYRPAEVMVHGEKDYLIRKRENFQNILENQILVEIEENVNC
jgi:diaminopimelate decarboxylase